jgi:hypothetical protein
MQKASDTIGENYVPKVPRIAAPQAASTLLQLQTLLQLASQSGGSYLPRGPPTLHPALLQYLANARVDPAAADRDTQRANNAPRAEPAAQKKQA